jgi:molybdopterin biosynthesis enzyme MoaB
VKKTQSFETIAHKGVLASVGVVDSSRDKVVQKIDQLFEESTSLFNNLLIKGESVEAQLQAKLKVGKMMDNKISAVLAKFGFGQSKRDAQLEKLSDRVDNLIDVVAKLVQQKSIEKKTLDKPVAVKTTAVANKTVDKETSTAVATKPAAKKPAPRKARAPKATVKTTEPTEPKVAKPRVRKAVSKPANKPSTPSAE